MTSALRWAAMRAILMFHNCEGQSHKTVSTDHNFWGERRAETDSNRGPSAYLPNALPLGQTGSLFPDCKQAFICNMNACRAPHLQMSPERFTMATLCLALFSASEQTHCTLVVCDSAWVTVALHSAFWISTEVFTALFGCWHGWYHVKLLPFQRTFCVHRSTVHQFTVSLYWKPHS